MTSTLKTRRDADIARMRERVSGKARLANKYIKGDCVKVTAKHLSANSVDLIVCDLPYGKVKAKWDNPVDLEALWVEYRRILKPRGAVLLFATQPFTTTLVNSNPAWFRYDIAWLKNRSTGHLNANRAPLRGHESILVFYDKQPTYNPQKTTGHAPVNSFYTRSSGSTFGDAETDTTGGGSTERHPTSVVAFDVVSNCTEERIHSAQKPVDLLRYLIRTYSNPGDLVLDNCAGSGSTGVASLLEGREYVCVDNDSDHVRAARAWLRTVSMRLR